MRTVNKILIITIALSAIFFMACEKEPIDIIEPIEPIEVHIEEQTENPLINSAGKTSAKGFTMDCITINFPFSFLSESEDIIRVKNEEEIEKALSNENNSIVDFDYPIEVTLYEDSTATIINNIEELVRVFIGCIPTDGWNEIKETGFPAFEFEGLCKELAYPVNLQSDRNTVVKVENKREFANALANDFLYFKFPITLVGKDGSTILATDGEILMHTLFNCETYTDTNTSPFDFNTCYEIYYPVALTDELGNTVTINNEDELYSLLFTGEVIDFVYPITLIGDEETTIAVANDKDMISLIELCAGEEEPNPPIDSINCFIIDYPVEMIDTFGNVLTVNNEEELIFPNNDFDFIYPITITLESGTITSIYNRSEIMNIWNDCEGNTPVVEPPTDSELCFIIDYPIEMIDSAGIVYTINNDNEFIIPNELFNFVYPIAITLEDGTFTNIDNQCELFNMLNRCDNIDDVSVIDFPLNYSDCFILDFPAQTIDAYGYTNVAFNVDDLNSLLLSGDCVDLIYPVTITRLDNGTTFNVDNLYHLNIIARACVNNPPVTNDLCFIVDYPIEMIDSAGIIYAINSDNEFVIPNGIIDFIYPIAITPEDDTFTNIDNQCELFNMLNRCDDIDDVSVIDFPLNYSDCFILDFPVQTIDAYGNTSTAYNDDELNSIVLSGECVDLIYPITITRLDNGNTLEIESLYRFSSIATRCSNEPPFVNPLCFGFDWPVQTIDTAGVVYTYNHTNYEELFMYLPSGEIMDFVYPFDIVYPDTTYQTINIFDEFDDAISDCP